MRGQPQLSSLDKAAIKCKAVGGEAEAGKEPGRGREGRKASKQAGGGGGGESKNLLALRTNPGGTQEAANMVELSQNCLPKCPLDPSIRPTR